MTEHTWDYKNEKTEMAFKESSQKRKTWTIYKDHKNAKICLT